MASIFNNTIRAIEKGASYVTSFLGSDLPDKIRVKKEITEGAIDVLNEALDKASTEKFFSSLMNSLDSLSKNHPDIKDTIGAEIQNFKDKNLDIPHGTNDPNLPLKQTLNNISIKLNDFSKNLTNNQDQKLLEGALKQINNFKENNLHLVQDRSINFSRTQFLAQKIGIDLVKIEEKYPKLAKAVDVTTKAVSKATSLVFNQTTGRALLLGTLIAGAVASGGTLAIATAAVAGVTTAIGIGFQVRKLQQIRDIHEERNLLKEYDNELQKSEAISRDPDISSLLTKQNILEDNKLKKSHTFDNKKNKKEASLLTSAGSFIRDNIGETGIALALSALSLNPFVIAASAGSAILSSAAGIIERNKMDERLSTAKKDIDHLRLLTPGYDNVFELKNKLKAVQLDNEAFKELSSKSNFNNMNSEEKKQNFLEIKEQFAKDPKFQIEPSPGIFQKAGSAVKNLVSDVANIVFISPFKNPIEVVEEKGIEKNKELSEHAVTQKEFKHKSIVLEATKEAALMTGKSLAAGSILLLGSSAMPGAIIGASASYAATAGTLATLAIATTIPSALSNSDSKDHKHSLNTEQTHHKHQVEPQKQHQQSLYFSRNVA